MLRSSFPIEATLLQSLFTALCWFIHHAHSIRSSAVDLLKQRMERSDVDDIAVESVFDEVDVAHVEEFTKPSAETTLGSQTIEESTKAPAPQNAESPYEEDDEDVILPDELDKEEDLDHEEDQNDLAPQIIEDEDDEDEDDKEQDEEPASKSGTDYLDDEDDDEED
ncbi:hypothetical protein Tco_0880386 [Tanacetum coccineum]